MSARRRKDELIIDWIWINRITIVATAILIFIWYIIDPASIFMIIKFLFRIVYLIEICTFWVLNNVLDNQTVGAAAGAFFAFVFMMNYNTNEKIDTALSKISAKSGMYNKAIIDKNILIIDILLDGISKKPDFYYPFDGFCLFQPYDSSDLISLRKVDLMKRIIDFDYLAQKTNQNMNDIRLSLLNTGIIKEGENFQTLRNGVRFNQTSICERLSSIKKNLDSLDDRNILILARVSTLIKKRERKLFGIPINWKISKEDEIREDKHARILKETAIKSRE